MEGLERCNAVVLGGVLPLALALLGGYFLVRLRRVWLRPGALLQRMLRAQRGGGVSPVRAMSLSLSGVLGVGNLVGVASALLYGGAGAVLWMWISATLAMLLKYAEVVLALRHRRTDGGGHRRGGAMYYMEDAFRGRLSCLGRWLGILFALLLLLDAFCMGCGIQVNAMTTALCACAPIAPATVGLLLCGVVVIVGLRGGRRLARLAEAPIPWMTLGFCLIALVALAQRGGELPVVVGRIVREGLSLGEGGGRELAGGVGAFAFSRGLRYGTARGLLSNEAGCGTSPMAHADADTEDAVAQGGMGMLEVVVDTHLLCTMTALVILLAYPQGELPALSPMLLTMTAFSRLLGAGAEWFLVAAVECFGFATVLCWSHYALRAGAYLFPMATVRGARLRDAVLVLLYGGFVVAGAVAAPDAFWQLSDLAIGCMTLINVAVLFRCRAEIVAVSCQGWTPKKCPRAREPVGDGGRSVRRQSR